MSQTTDPFNVVIPVSCTVAQVHVISLISEDNYLKILSGIPTMKKRMGYEIQGPGDLLGTLPIETFCLQLMGL